MKKRQKPINYYPSGYDTNVQLTVSEATEILSQWGISHNDKKTRDLIAKNKLVAVHAGSDPNDRRSGYIVKGKALYDLIISEIPIAKEILDQKVKERSKKKPATKANETNNEKDVE